MANVFECDRCMQRMAGRPAHQLRRQDQRKVEVIDLCEGCMKKFRDWVDNGKSL